MLRKLSIILFLLASPMLSQAQKAFQPLTIDALLAHKSFQLSDRRGSVHVFVKTSSHIVDQGLPYEIHLLATCGKQFQSWIDAISFDMNRACEVDPQSFSLSTDRKRVSYRMKERDDAFYEHGGTDDGVARCKSEFVTTHFDISLEGGICALED